MWRRVTSGAGSRTAPALRDGANSTMSSRSGLTARPASPHLCALCPRHQHLKHDSGWTLTGDPEGTLIWTSPTGHRYTSEPEPLAVDPGLTATGQSDELVGLCWLPDGVGDVAVSAADEAEVDAWLDHLLLDELYGSLPATPQPDWLDAALQATTPAATDSTADDPPPF